MSRTPTLHADELQALRVERAQLHAELRAELAPWTPVNDPRLDELDELIRESSDLVATADQIKAAIAPSRDDLVAYRRVSADGDLFVIACRSYGLITIGEIDLAAADSTIKHHRSIPAPAPSSIIGIALEVAQENVIRNLLAQGL
jgi:hypothetical protein